MYDWEFIVGGVCYRLVTDRGPALAGQRLSDLLHRWAWEGHTAVLHDLAHRLGLRGPLAPCDEPHALAQCLANALSAALPSAQLLREPEPERNLGPAPEGTVDISDLLPLPPAAPPPEVDHWIEVSLLDSGHEPIANERFELVLPDGKIHGGRTDDEGRLRIDPIFKGGHCRLHFPDLETELAAAG